MEPLRGRWCMLRSEVIIDDVGLGACYWCCGKHGGMGSGLRGVARGCRGGELLREMGRQWVRGCYRRRGGSRQEVVVGGSLLGGVNDSYPKKRHDGLFICK
ncbi:unnamed protein product, partial [Dovyalis caffra]